MNKGLRHIYRPHAVLQHIVLRKKDLMKKGLRRPKSFLNYAPWLSVRNEDLTKKGLRLIIASFGAICLNKGVRKRDLMKKGLRLIIYKIKAFAEVLLREK